MKKSLHRIVVSKSAEILEICKLAMNKLHGSLQDKLGLALRSCVEIHMN